MTVYIKDLITIPEQVNKGDFVLNLSEGVTRPQETLSTYVITPQLVGCFDNALQFIKSALETRTSKSAYLHGSFGSGKSHFMAILHLILQNHPKARSHPDLVPICARHNFIEDKKFLLIPYHMIGSRSMESAILGGYGSYIRTLHPGVPLPPVYLADKIFDNAQQLRMQVGDDNFFAQINREKGDSGWGKLEEGWNAASFDAALAAPPRSDDRLRLIGDLVTYVFPAYESIAKSEGESFVPLDEGLSTISRHAALLDYDGLILFLDELILWLASHAADLQFVHREGQKLTKLVEAQTADRPVPIISFVARQRDLRELVGEHITGAEQLNFSDALKHWEGRFHRINLEDRNLPDIVEKRLLKPSSLETKKLLDDDFNETLKIRENVLDVLLTSKADREMFRKVYPFSPALVEALVAISSVLQRERTALKIMLELLVNQRETLELGHIVPVGDLFDIIAHGEEVFTDVMRINFDNAKRLYHLKLLPLLEETHGVSMEPDSPIPAEDPEALKKIQGFKNDDRLVKTLLLAAIVPEIESFKKLTAAKLAALNHGTVKSPIPGREGTVVNKKIRDWASRIGEIKISAEMENPTISIQLSGVDTETILAQARSEDNQGNRRRKVRELLFEALDITDDEMGFFVTHHIVWRGTRRDFHVLYANVRELNPESLESEDEDWKLIIDFPFDQPGYSPRDDIARIESYKNSDAEGSPTLIWLPSFFSASTQKELGTLVILDHVLSGERFKSYSAHLSPTDRTTALTLLRNQRSSLYAKMMQYLEMAYGLRQPSHGVIDGAYSMEASELLQSLFPGHTPQILSESSFKEALENTVGAALSSQYPAHPDFEVEGEIKINHIKALAQELEKSAGASGGRLFIEDKNIRVRLRQIAQPLHLGEMGETHFVPGRYWINHFNGKLAAHKPESLTVRLLGEWKDDPRPMGLPSLLNNLIIFYYAVQTNRSFAIYGTPISPNLDQFKPEMELVEVALPSEEEWDKAIERISRIFELKPPRVRNASNVKFLQKDIREKIIPIIDNCTKLPSALTTLGTTLSCGQDYERLITAQRVNSLITAISKAHDDAIISTIGGFSITEPLDIIGASVRTSERNVDTIDNFQLELIEALKSIQDERKADAGKILQDARETVIQNEFVVKLAPALKDAQKKAVQLLAKPQKKAADPVKDPSPDIEDQAVVISEGNRDNLAFDQAHNELDKIKKALDKTRVLSIKWRITNK